MLKAKTLLVTQRNQYRAGQWNMGIVFTMAPEASGIVSILLGYLYPTTMIFKNKNT